MAGYQDGIQAAIVCLVAPDSSDPALELANHLFGQIVGPGQLPILE